MIHCILCWHFYEPKIATKVQFHEREFVVFCTFPLTGVARQRPVQTVMCCWVDLARFAPPIFFTFFDAGKKVQRHTRRYEKWVITQASYTPPFHPLRKFGCKKLVTKSDLHFCIWTFVGRGEVLAKQALGRHISNTARADHYWPVSERVHVCLCVCICVWDVSVFACLCLYVCVSLCICLCVWAFIT